MNAEEFILDVIDSHHDNIDGEPAGAGYEEHIGASVVLLFDDGTALRVRAEVLDR